VKVWQAKALPVWVLFCKKSKGNKDMVSAILAAKKKFAAGGAAGRAP